MYKHITVNAHTPTVGALNFSHLLDAPAGKHGHTVVRDGKLYFEDGVRARFFGFNLAGSGILPKKETAEAYAERLASLGCNVVRLHAADGLEPNFPSTDYKNSLIDYSEKGRGRTLDRENLDRLHYFVYCLKQKGIYVQVDLLCYRIFTDIGDLEHTPPQSRVKAMSIFNEGLIKLQKEFATEYLSAVNPYTGMSFLEDPCVMAIQVTNENSAFYTSIAELKLPERAPFEAERKRRFNEFLTKKYGTREALAAAWTRQGECALLPEEDPLCGTVEPIGYGDYKQPYCDHKNSWIGLDSPARYADYMEFGIGLNLHYYEEMLAHIRSLNPKAPINGANLTRGAADTYSTNVGADIAENNAYFNHPGGGIRNVRFSWKECINTDPRSATYPNGYDGSHILSQLSCGNVKDMPFVVSEWNEYGGQPFHSPTFLMTAAYARLQDWDGLMLYRYTSSNDHTELSDSYIEHVYEAYKDPSLIGQIGAVATVFLGGDVQAARRTVDICYTREDMKMLPDGYRNPYGFLPFISRTRALFTDEGYASDADLAVSAGFASNGDYTKASHALVYARTPYEDALEQKYVGTAFLDRHRGEDAVPFLDLGTLSGNSAVIDLDKTDSIERDSDYTGFSRFADGAMKHWGLWDADKGIVGDSCFVSDTGEIRFDFGEGEFRLETPSICIFSGYPKGKPIALGSMTAEISNEKMSFSLLSRDGKPLSDSRHLVLLATGNTGNDDNRWDGNILLEFRGHISAEEPVGTLTVPDARSVYALDIYGNRLYELPKNGDSFKMGGENTPAAMAFEIFR